MKKIVFLFLFAVLTMANVSNAQPMGGVNAGGPMQRPEAREPLTPEQMEQARKIFDDSYDDLNSTRQALAMKRAELDDELASSKPDKAKIERLSREIGELRGKLLSARVDVRNRLSQQGLPSDYYGPGSNNGGYWNNGPGVWHGGRHHGYGRGYDSPNGGWSCPGMRSW